MRNGLKALALHPDSLMTAERLQTLELQEKNH